MSNQNSNKELETELSAIKTIIDALDQLDDPTKYRVLSYALDHLKISFSSNKAPAVAHLPLPTGTATTETIIHPTLEATAVPISDIRSLKEVKQPTSANEMAALVAYYVSELAPIDERRNTIASSDLDKYFKQAGFPLPKALSQTLINATASGYFDKIDGGYKLNPVGYNLVVHGLPGGKKVTSKKQPRKSKQKKSAKKSS